MFAARKASITGVQLSTKTMGLRMFSVRIKRITEKVLADGLPQGVCLNVNFPKVPDYQGVKVCRMAKGTWGNEVTQCHHPRGYDYWWMVGQYTNDEPDADDTDNWALSHGYIAITPTQIDVTAYQALDLIKSWRL